MTRHVVGTFIGMGEMGIVIRHQSIQEILQIPPGGRVRIFHQNQAATGVAAEGGDLAGLQAGRPQRLQDKMGNFVSTLARRPQGKGLLVNLHAAQSRAEDLDAQLKKGLAREWKSPCPHISLAQWATHASPLLLLPLFPPLCPLW